AEQAAAVAAAKLEASLDARQALERSLDESKHHAQEKDAELAGVRTELREAHTAADTLRAELLATVRPRTRRALPATQTRKKP
ncbi:hypothetical protein, partial [Paraburkholderia phenazinium]